MLFMGSVLNAVCYIYCFYYSKICELNLKKKKENAVAP